MSWPRRAVHAVVSRARSHGERLRWRAIDELAGARRRTDSAAVALTFDDGPQPGSTDRVLDVLAELDVRATFFCVGKNATAHPGLLRRIKDDGHAIGSHSQTHPDPEATALAQLAADYAQGHESVVDALGEPVSLFRPPRGYLDLRRALQVRRHGWRPWLWSVDPQDWQPDRDRCAIETEAGRAQAGDVVLLHDWIEQPWAPSALDRSATIEALPGIVSAVRARGLGFTTLAER